MKRYELTEWQVQWKSWGLSFVEYPDVIGEDFFEYYSWFLFVGPFQFRGYAK